MNPTAKTIEQLGCIDEYIGGSCHRRIAIVVVLFVPSSRRNFKFLRAKEEAQEALDDEIN
jgi:hypothetical protein